jgi:hypothetical protein
MFKGVKYCKKISSNLPYLDFFLPSSDPYLPASDPYLPASDPYLPASDPYLPGGQKKKSRAEKNPLDQFLW